MVFSNLILILFTDRLSQGKLQYKGAMPLLIFMKKKNPSSLQP